MFLVSYMASKDTYLGQTGILAIALLPAGVGWGGVGTSDHLPMRAQGRGPGSPEKTVSSGNRKHRTASYILFSVVNYKVLMDHSTPLPEISIRQILIETFYFPDTVSDAWEISVDKIKMSTLVEITFYTA